MWNVLLLCAVVSSVPSCKASTDDTSTALNQRMNKMEEEILALEFQQRKTLEEKEELSRRLLEVEMVLKRERSVIEILEIKENLTRTLITSYITSQRDVQEVIRKNIASSAENLKLHVNESLLRFDNVQSDLTKKISILEHSLLEFEKDYANASFVAKLDESSQNLDRTMKMELRSIQDELYPRVKRLEERGDLRDDVAEIEKTVRNHSSEIGTLNRQVFGSMNFCAGDPPSLLNGKVLDFERKHGSYVQYECNQNFVTTGNSTVLCQFGAWEGHPPVCSYFDKSFYLEIAHGYIMNFTCYSDENSNRIKFSQLIDIHGTSEDVTANTSKHITSKSAGVDFDGVDFDYRFGVFQCGFNREGRTMDIVLPLQRNVEIYFPDRTKVANLGDTVELRMKLHYREDSQPRDSIRWRHNKVLVPSWDDKSKIEIRNVQPSDAGIYEIYLRHYPTSYNRAIMRLVVRKCKADMYGEQCDQKCPSCYNGGVCHDLLGICLCPEGFLGTLCERACPAGFHGADCSTECENLDCKMRYYCKPDPYGCSCARGFTGYFCDKNCDPGWYGADCQQPCHCSKGPDSCNRFTGACSEGCAPGWSGESCQINVTQ